MNVPQRDKQFLNMLSALKPAWGTPEHSEYLSEVARRAFRTGDALDINAIDPIDPCHLKISNHVAEADHDGDAGREDRENQT